MLPELPESRMYADRFYRSLGQIAAFEAMSCRVPVIAARTFHLRDYFDDGEHILFYEPGDPGDLRRRIESVLNDTSLRQRLITNAYERVSQEYTPEKYTELLLRICND